ncbi:MAG: 4-hydroxy-tetrahydrodipicolinate reductase [Bacteroidota bacterium]
MNIALIGYGRMGKEVEVVAKEKGLNVVRTFTTANNKSGEALNPESLKDVDVCIDFSSPSAAVANIEAVVKCGKNMVMGTTGWYDRMEYVKGLVTEKKIGFLYAANFSPGVNIFSRIVEDASLLFDKHTEYDVAIHEIHHKEKADSPGGTALSLASLLLNNLKRKTELLTEPSKGKIKPHQLHVTSARVGHTTGQHTITFDSDNDTIELIHTARSRRGYAVGAVLAAQWLQGKTGFHTMQDVIS